MGRTSYSTMINTPEMKSMLNLMRRAINTMEFNVMNVKDMITLGHNVLHFLKNRRRA